MRFSMLLLSLLYDVPIRKVHLILIDKIVTSKSILCATRCSNYYSDTVVSSIHVLSSMEIWLIILYVENDVRL